MLTFIVSEAGRWRVSEFTGRFEMGDPRRDAKTQRKRRGRLRLRVEELKTEN
jgi:hypothetical protein